MDSKKKFEIEIEGVYPSVNKVLNWHWSRRRSWIQGYKLLVKSRIRKANIPPLNDLEVSVTLCFEKKRRRDLGNYEPKYLIDVLVDCRVIEDDNSQVLKKRAEVEIISPSEKDKTILRLKGYEDVSG